MMAETNIAWVAMSDVAIMETMGAYVRQQRLAQNKTQQQLATEAGLNRSTLGEFERGMRPNVLTLIQLLRALHLLHLLQPLQPQPQISPLQLAKIAQKQPKRASKTKPVTDSLSTDW